MNIHDRRGLLGPFIIFENCQITLLFSCDHVTLLCQLRQLKVVDVHKFLLRGIIRSEKKSLEYIIPQSLRVSKLFT